MSDLIFNPDGHTGYHDGKLWPSVTQIIKAAGLSRFNGVPEENLEAARIRGRAVDKACEFIDKGLRFQWPSPEIERMFGGYVDAYRKFCADLDYKSELVQHIVHDHTYQYFGILDTFGTADYLRLPAYLKATFQIKGRHWLLIDRKTGPFGADVGLQLAGYLRALETAPFFTGPKSTMILRLGLKLNYDGTYDPPTPFIHPLDEKIFLSALTVTNWKGVNL